MAFQEYFEELKKKFSGVDVSQINDSFAIEVNLTGRDAGTFYVACKEGKLSVEPYEYRDRDVKLTASCTDFQKIVDRKLDPVLAFTLGKLKAEGDLGKALELKKLLKEAQ